MYDERDDSEEDDDEPPRRPAPTPDDVMPGSPFVSTMDGDVYKVLSRGKSRSLRMQEWDTDANEPFDGFAQISKWGRREGLI